VAVADFDRQKSVLAWAKMRPDTVTPVTVLNWRSKFGQSPAKIQRLVVDCPAGLTSKLTKRVIAEADVLVVPLAATFFDEHSTLRFLKSVEDVKRVRKGQTAILLVANRVRPGSREAAALEGLILGHGYRLTGVIPDRAIYSRTAAQGLTVFDSAARPALEQQEHWMPLIEAIEAARDETR
jgi:chromosome partitioning protein